MNNHTSNIFLNHQRGTRTIIASIMVAGMLAPLSASAASLTDTANAVRSNSVVSAVTSKVKSVVSTITSDDGSPVAATPVATTPTVLPTTDTPVATTTTPVITTAPVASSVTSSVASSNPTSSQNAASTSTASEPSYYQTYAAADNANVSSSTAQATTVSAVSDTTQAVFDTIHNFKLSSYSSYGSATMLSTALTSLLLRSAALVGTLGIVMLLLPGRYPRRRPVSVPVVDAP